MSEQQRAMVRITERGLVPSDLDGLWRVANMVAQSGLAPKGIDRPESIATAMVMGQEIGLTPMQSLQSIAVINGRPSIWGDAALALCLPHLAEPPLETVEGEGDERSATCSVTRKGAKHATARGFSVRDAKRAGLWGKAGPWTQYPDRMLQLRARGFALRDSCADILRGIAIREEAMDLAPTQYTVRGVADDLDHEMARAQQQTLGEVEIEEQPEVVNEEVRF